jgi:predicted dehydrogenase
MTTLRVGLVGGGLVSQAAHLHFLWHLRDRFAVVGLVDPSEVVRTELARRYGIPAAYPDHRQLIDAGGVDALFVCTPNATHAAIVTDALEAGLHVFVEKPLCITLADADRIVALRDEVGTVVQVGYTKRFDVAYEEMCRNLPDTTETLRYIDVLTYEPELSQYFRPADMVIGSDLSDAFREAGRREEGEQVAAAVGTRTGREAFMFSEVYLGSLVHDVNLVHGLLEQMGEPLPSSVADSAWWEGPSATASMPLSTGARWGLTWIETTSLHDFREQISLFFEDAVHTITFPPPYLVHSPAIYECNSGSAGRRESRLVSSYQERFVRQLTHFHDCVTTGTPCCTPPEQARADIALLTKLFLAARDAGCGGER